MAGAVEVPRRRADGATGGRGELVERFRLAVGRLSRLLNQQAKGELTLSQWSALRTVAKFGPLRMGELAVHEHLAGPTLSRIVAGLEEQALIDRSADPRDGRVGVLHVTEAGARTLAELRSRYAELLTRLLGELGEGQRATLATALPVLEELVERLAEGGCAAGKGGYAGEQPGRGAR